MGDAKSARGHSCRHTRDGGQEGPSREEQTRRSEKEAEEYPPAARSRSGQIQCPKQPAIKGVPAGYRHAIEEFIAWYCPNRAATAPDHFQATTDGFAPYRTAIPNTLEDRADYAMLIKVYKASVEGEARYSPAEVASVEVVPVLGRPDPERICTSIVERQNLSVRMGTRRFTRLTNAYSKKWENHWAAVALWMTFYNFCRVHRPIRMTPAMAAGITGRIWTGAIYWRRKAYLPINNLNGYIPSLWKKIRLRILASLRTLSHESTSMYRLL